MASPMQYGPYGNSVVPYLNTGGTMTPATGNTMQGSQLAAIQQAFDQIKGAASGDINQAYGNTANAAIGMQAGQPAFATATQQNMQNQYVQPFINQIPNLEKMVQLYQHDQFLNQQAQQLGNITGGQNPVNPYQNPNLMASSQAAGNQLLGENQQDINQVSGMGTSAQPNTAIAPAQATPGAQSNPYLAPASDIINSAVGTLQAPSLTTAEMGRGLSGTNYMYSLLNSIIGSQQGVAGSQTQKAMDEYTGRTSALASLANMLGGELSQRGTSAQNAVNIPGTKQNAGGLFNDIITQLQQEKGGKATEQDIWNYINQHDASLRDQGANVDELWRLHKDLAGKVGWNGLLTGGKTAAKTSATDVKAQKAKEDTQKSYQITSGTLQQLLDQYSNLSDLEKTPLIGNALARSTITGAHTYDQQRKGLSVMLKELAGAGAGSGVRVTQAEINMWADLLPAPGDTESQIKQKITSLNAQLKQKFGKGLDSKYLQQFGIQGSSSNTSTKYKILKVE